MTSPADVCNVALTMVGETRFISRVTPSDGSAAGNVAALIYPSKIDNLHRAANWNFCRKQTTLTLLRATVIDGETSDDPPPVPWLFEYAYPADCLKARFIIPTLNSDSITPPLTTATTLAMNSVISEPAKYIVMSDTDTDGNPIKVICTNQEDAILVYCGRVDNPDLWDSGFLEAAQATLASWFASALARNPTMIRMHQEAAMGIVAKARVDDGNEGLTATDHVPDWMRIRGFGPGALTQNMWASGWDLMSWPSGLML